MYRLFFESAKDGLLILDAETGNVMDANPFMVTLLDCAEEQVIGQKVWELEFFKDIVANEKSFGKLTQNDYLHLEDKSINTSSGHRIAVDFVSNVYLVNSHRMIQCHFRDITERKHAETIERARFDRAQQQLEAISRISASQALLNGDVERLAREITEEAAHVTAVERANLWLFNEHETELHCIDLYESSTDRHSAGMVLRQNEFENEFNALKDASYVAANNPFTDPRTAGYVESYLTPLGITSMLDTVIEVADKHLGLLCLEHVGKTHDWEADEIAFAGRLADKIPVAIASRIRRNGEDEIRALARFPNENPNAILRVAEDGRILYANPACIPLQELFNASDGRLARGDLIERVRECLASGETRNVETKHGTQIFSVTLVPFRAEGYANIYGLNITDQKRAEAALRDSHALLTATERIACVGGFDWDLTRDVLVWSEELYRIFGQEPGHYTPTVAGFVASIHPDDRERMQNVIAACLQGKVPADIQYRIIRPDGTQRVIESHSEIKRDHAGKPLRITSTSQDVTERRRTEDALRESQQLIEGIINAIPVRVFWKDKNLVYLGCNTVFARDAGIAEPKDIVGKDDYQMAWRDQAELYRSDDREVLDSRLPKGPIEEPQTTPDGSTITLLTSKMPLTDPSGEIRGVLGTYIDITERKRSEKTMLRTIGALKTLSSCNMALVHACDEESLLNEICRILVTMSGYSLAWVGFAEDGPEKTVYAVAHGGYTNGFMEQSEISWDATAARRGPVGAAICTSEPQLIRNAHTDPRYEPWRQSAIKTGYQSVLCLPLATGDTAFGALCMYATESDAFDDQQIRLLSGLAHEVAFGILALRARTEHQQSQERLRRGMEATIEALAGTLELRDAYTAGHQRRVAELAAAIGREMGIAEDEIHGIHLAATVHDLGKIQVPAEILTKPTRLTTLEFELVKTHAQAGYDLLKGIDFPWPIAELVYQHHERLDGSGYPRGLRGEDILMGAKILAVADTIEAMSSHRPYRAGLGIEVALLEIMENQDKLYDPQVVDGCVKLFHQKRFAFSV
jgi:PAS domain S-box-containing protein